MDAVVCAVVCSGLVPTCAMVVVRPLRERGVGEGERKSARGRGRVEFCELRMGESAAAERAGVVRVEVDRLAEGIDGEAELDVGVGRRGFGSRGEGKVKSPLGLPGDGERRIQQDRGVDVGQRAQGVRVVASADLRALEQHRGLSHERADVPGPLADQLRELGHGRVEFEEPGRVRVL
jgi:hypothetical protein